MNHGRSFWILAHMFAAFAAQTPIAEIRQRGRYVRSVPLGGVPIPSLEYYGRRRVRRLLALARVVFFVPELARVARCKATSVFAAAFVFLADILFPFCALDSWGLFGTTKAGFGVWGVSAISSPNRAATSLSSSTLAVPGAAVFSGGACPALASNSFSSTSRSTKRS